MPHLAYIHCICTFGKLIDHLLLQLGKAYLYSYSALMQTPPAGLQAISDAHITVAIVIPLAFIL